MEKATIKVSILKSELKYNELLELKNNTFLLGLQDGLGVEFTYSELNDYDCDLKLIFVQTGGSEGKFLANFDDIKAPYYLLTNGQNNSLAASLEILTYLKLHNLQGEILHGDNQYLINRIKTLLSVNRVKSKLASQRLGVIGTPSDWLIASVSNYDVIKEKLGIELVDIELEKVEKGYINTFNQALNFDGFDQEEIKKASKVYTSIKQIIKDYSLNGFTVRCFDLIKSLKTTGCLALANLNSEGITSTCEGDIASMLSMHLVKMIFDKPSFQANPSEIDVTNNLIILAHCTIPFDMAKSFKFDTHFESGVAVSVKAELEETKVTIFRLQSDLKDFYITTGTITRNLSRENLCRTQIEVKLDSDVSELLKKPCGNHQIVFYGDHKEELTNIMRELLK